jgi:acetyl-CoA acyltransferase 1
MTPVTPNKSALFQQSDSDVVFVAAARTPLLRAVKDPAKEARPSPQTFLSTVLQQVLQRAKVNGPEIEDICVGNVLLGPNGFVTCRMAHVMAGIPAETTSLQVVNRQCASGLQAVANIAYRIQAGEIKVGIAAGLECMSWTPMHTIKAPVIDSATSQNKSALDCLLPMGITSETVVKEYGLERHVLDKCAVDSHKRAARAQEAGMFDAEIVPVGQHTSDNGIRAETTLDVLGKLKPAFTPTGVTTAGNSSQMTDGAAALVMMTRGEAHRRKLPIMGVWKGMSTVGVPPAVMGIGPAVAIPALLDQMRLSKDEVGLYEINEAFASQYTYTLDHLQLDVGKVNVNGGAIALGHPLGCTGARLLVSLLYELQRRKETTGVVSMCIGTGMGAAALIVRDGIANL